MKKIVSFLLLTALVAGSLFAAGGKDGGKKTIFDKQKEFEYIKDKKKEKLSSIGSQSEGIRVVVNKQ